MDCDDNPPFIRITPTRTSRIVSQRAARNPPDFSRSRRPSVPRHGTEAVEDTGYLSIIYDYFIMTSTWGAELDRMTGSRSERHLLAKRSLISTPPGLYRHTFPLWRSHQRRGHQYESHNRQGAIYTEIYIFTSLFYSASQNKNSLMHTPSSTSARTAMRTGPAKDRQPLSVRPQSLLPPVPHNANRHGGYPPCRCLSRIEIRSGKPSRLSPGVDRRNGQNPQASHGLRCRRQACR
ncbi:hypothetical protein SAMN05880590_1111 [Rhizobium sp. RU35A]|nr:hypothetical protein SAMN05880590_1111 [Rhizobium sp. RU35A]